MAGRSSRLPRETSPAKRSIMALPNHIRILAAAALVHFCPAAIRAQGDRSPAAAARAVAAGDFSQLPDAPTQVVEATIVDHDGDAPAYCRVRGYVAPQVGFVAWLPLANWNGKLLELGHGGS